MSESLKKDLAECGGMHRRIGKTCGRRQKKQPYEYRLSKEMNDACTRFLKDRKLDWKFKDFRL